MAQANFKPDFKIIVDFPKIAAALYSASNIVTWIKRTIGIELEEFQDLATGVVFCKIIRKLFPESISLRRLYRNSTIKDHYVHNLKLMETALQSLGVKREMNIDLIAAGEPAKILEFAQWLRQFYDTNNRIMRQNKIRCRGQSEARCSRKTAVGNNVLDTRRKQRNFSVGGVLQKVDAVAPFDRLNKDALKKMPESSMGKSGVRKVAGAAASDLARCAKPASAKPPQRKCAKSAKNCENLKTTK